MAYSLDWLQFRIHIVFYLAFSYWQTAVSQGRSNPALILGVAALSVGTGVFHVYGTNIQQHLARYLPQDVMRLVAQAHKLPHVLIMAAGGFILYDWITHTTTFSPVGILKELFAEHVIGQWSADSILVSLVYIIFVLMEGSRYFGHFSIALHSLLAVLLLHPIGIPLLALQIGRPRPLADRTRIVLLIVVVAVWILQPTVGLMAAWSENLFKHICSFPQDAMNINPAGRYGSLSITVSFFAVIYWAMTSFVDGALDVKDPKGSILRTALLISAMLQVDGHHVAVALGAILLSVGEKDFWPMWRCFSFFFFGFSILFFAAMSFTYPGAPWYNGHDCYAPGGMAEPIPGLPRPIRFMWPPVD